MNDTNNAAHETTQTLLAITGLSPQVVTETLYAIHQQGLEWPNEIQIITTAKGKQQAELGLITPPQGHDKSRLAQLCEDYQRPIPRLTSNDILVVPDSDGNSVDDARTLADQEALANFIVSHVATLCSNPNRTVHASLAGGRKTMTFYLGYAMTLFARQGDRLSHVLVEASFEGVSDFYYPTPTVTAIRGRGDNQMLDASKATVMLSEIPFIRQREQLDKSALASFAAATVVADAPSYRELVRFQNMASDRAGLAINFDLANRLVRIDHHNNHGATINFQHSPLELAFWAMAARHSQLINPVKLTRPTDGDYDRTLAHLFMQELERINDVTLTNMPTASDYQARWVEARDNWALSEFDRSVNSLAKGMDRTFFDQRKNTLKTKLLSQFPQTLVDCLLPAGVFRFDAKTKTYHPCLFEGKASRNSAMGLWLDHANVHLTTSLTR